MTDQRPPDGTDERLEARLRESFARLAPPSAPDSILAASRSLAERPDSVTRRPLAGRFPLVLAAVAVLLGVGLVGTILSIGRHSTTQGEDPSTPAASESVLPSTVPPSPSIAPTPTPSATVVAGPRELDVGRYRSRSALLDRWCIELDVARARYDSDEQVEVQTWPPADDAGCDEPPDPEAPPVDDKGWNLGSIGPLEDGTPAVFVRLYVNMTSPQQELDLSLRQTDCCLQGIAASFGDAVIELERLGDAAPPPEPEEPRFGPEPMRPIEVDPAAGPDLPLAGWDVPGQVTCGGMPFPIAGLWGTPGAERGVGPAPEALREVMRTPYGFLTTGAGRPIWEAGRTADWAIYLSAGPDRDLGSLEFVEVGLRDGRWQFHGSGDCRLRAWTPPGYGNGYWALDPAFEPPQATTTTLHLLVTEERCSSGRSALGRVSPAFVIPSRTEIGIQLYVKTRPRGQDCLVDVAPAAVTIELPQPLGDRPLLDWNVDPCPFCGG